MKISTAMSRAVKTWSASFGKTTIFFLVELCLFLICLAPALFLFENGMEKWALICPVLWVLIMFPARLNAAGAMRDALNGGSLATTRMISTDNYGGELVCALKRLFFLLLWSTPLIAIICYAMEQYSGEVDALTVMKVIRFDIGGGDLMTGVKILIGIVVAAILLLVFGCAFHSGARHAYMQGDKDLVNGHHGKVLLSWLCSLVTILPLLIAIGILLARYLPVVSDLTGILMGTASLPDTKTSEYILIAGAVLTLPFLPLRSLIPAAMVDGIQKEQA